MPANPKSQPSFSSSRRWRIGLDMVVRTVLVLAVVMMVNYLGARFFGRFFLSSQTRHQIVFANPGHSRVADQSRGRDAFL